MDNYLLMKKSSDLVDFSKSLGFEKTLFLGEQFILLESKSKRELLKKTVEAKQKGLLTVYRVQDEELLRFALEKTPVDIVLGIENIHAKDSVHYVRGGLDQVLCKIAAEQGKIIGFSFAELLNSANPAAWLRRVKANVRLCQKYQVKLLFSTFATAKMELRSKKDLEAFSRILGITTA